MNPNRFKGGVGYSALCQKGRCTSCRNKECECPHHPYNGSGTPDAQLVQWCVKNALNRSWLGYQCQQERCGYCRTSGCHCRCHIAGESPLPAPIVKADLPLASDENVLELQARIYEAEASILNSKDEFAQTVKESVSAVGKISAETDEAIKDFEKRMTQLEKTKKVEFKIPGKAKPIEAGLVHKDFEQLVEYVEAQEDGAVYMVGPAGGGKTKAMSMVARVLDLNYYPQSFGMQTTQSSILGYVDANGKCVHSQAYKALNDPKGGLWGADEVDATNAGVMTSANVPLRNSIVGWGCNCGAMEINPKSRRIAGANTFGKGADHLYVGRNQLDAATLDGFTWFPWDYDWDLTRAIAGDEDGFTTYVERLFECASELKLRLVIGPRKAIYGNRLLRRGRSREEVEQHVLWANIDTDDRRKLMTTMDRKFPQPVIEIEVKQPDTDYVEDDEEESFPKAEAPEGAENEVPTVFEQIVSANDEKTACPKCHTAKAVMDNAAKNAVRKTAGKKPLPEKKCIYCNYHVWPEGINWDKKTWGDGTQFYS